MKLFLIALPTQKVGPGLLVNSCKERGIECEILDPTVVNPLDVDIKPGDAIYRVSDSAHYNCLALEYNLLKPGVISFYKDNNPLMVNHEENDSLLLQQLGIPVPKTVNYIPKDRAALKAAAEGLGGVPLIIKALGGGHGVGVMRVDSYESLFSVGDYLNTTDKKYVLKQYLNVTSSARLIVLNGKVIDSIEYRANKDDFRSNEGKVPNVSPKKFDVAEQELAIKATKALGLEFAGVDLLLSDTGTCVAEVNFPCFFARCQMLTGTDISGMMLDYLLEKSSKK